MVILIRYTCHDLWNRYTCRYRNLTYTKDSYRLNFQDILLFNVVDIFGTQHAKTSILMADVSENYFILSSLGKISFSKKYYIWGFKDKNI